MSLTEQWIKNASQATPVLYLDLDDTVRKGPTHGKGFVNCAADVEVFDIVPGILVAYKQKGWRIIAISNQGGVALGYLKFEDAAAAALETNRQCQNLFDQIMMCTHHPDAEDPEFAVCWCRKPRIGLVIDGANTVAKRHNEYYPPHLGLFVGDRPEDARCAENAGLAFMDAAEWRGGGWKTPLDESLPYVTLPEYQP